MVRRSVLRTLVGVFVGLTVMLLASPLHAQALRGTAKPTSFKVTVTQVELWNSSAWVTVFTGSAQLDLLAGGTFPGIDHVTLPGGTYSKARVTVLNSFDGAGSVNYLGTTYYVTSTPGPFVRTATASTSAASAGPNAFSNPFWGAVGAAFRFPDFTITPITVTPATNYAPTLKFDVTNSLELYEVLGQFYFTLAQPVVTIL